MAEKILVANLENRYYQSLDEGILIVILVSSIITTLTLSARTFFTTEIYRLTVAH